MLFRSRPRQVNRFRPLPFALFVGALPADAIFTGDNRTVLTQISRPKRQKRGKRKRADESRRGTKNMECREAETRRSGVRGDFLYFEDKSRRRESAWSLSRLLELRPGTPKSTYFPDHSIPAPVSGLAGCGSHSAVCRARVSLRDHVSTLIPIFAWSR